MQEKTNCLSVRISAELYDTLEALTDRKYRGCSIDSICELLLWRGLGRTEQIQQARENGGEW